MLLHGFGTSSFLWRDVGPGIAVAGHTAFALDLFGHGESDRPIDAPFGIAAQAEYVDQALVALRIASAVFVGVDIGGGVALRLAATRPERVRALVLINSVGFDDFPGEDIRAVQRNTARFAVRVSRSLLGAAALLRPLLTKSVARPENMPERLIARYLAPFVGRDGVSHLLTLARAIRASDLEDLDLRELRVPVTVVRGEADRWLDPRLGERLANAIRDSRLVVIPEVARLLPEDDPEQTITLVLEAIAAAALAERGVTAAPSPGGTVVLAGSAIEGTPAGQTR